MAAGIRQGTYTKQKTYTMIVAGFRTITSKKERLRDWEQPIEFDAHRDIEMKFGVGFRSLPKDVHVCVPDHYYVGPPELGYLHPPFFLYMRLNELHDPQSRFADVQWTVKRKSEDANTPWIPIPNADDVGQYEIINTGQYLCAYGGDTWHVGLNRDKDLVLRVTILVRLYKLSTDNRESYLQDLRKWSLENLQEDMENLLADTTTADLTIRCKGGEEVQAHQTILLARNTKFHELWLQSKGGLLNADQVPVQIMKIILHYLYTGKLLDGWDDPTCIEDFLEASKFFELTDMITKLGEFEFEGKRPAEAEQRGDESRMDE